MLAKLDYTTAKDFMLPKHYSGRVPSISYAFGWYECDTLVAVLTVGKPASPALCTGVCGKELSSHVYELNRVCTNGNMIMPLSMFVGACLRALRSEHLILVSYADTQMHHHGYIYQATNWLYTGATKARTDIFSGKGKHARHYDKTAVQTQRVRRSSKHRYVIFTGSKTFKRHCLLHLKYKQESYPKGVNTRYTLGEYIVPEVYNVEGK